MIVKSSSYYILCQQTICGKKLSVQRQILSENSYVICNLHITYESLNYELLF